MVVTGSRIVSPNLQSISPITAIGAEELNIAGKTRIEDVLNQLPQAFASQGSNISNGSDGTATVDLRGLGPQRTLVLVNGRRLMPGDPDGGSAADLNQIPLSLVKRVDVLTGGASSVYGADAVAGVVNFVMDTEFEGVRVDYNYGFYNHKNDSRVAEIVDARGFPLPDSTVNAGYSKDFSIAVGIGGAEGRGHATFYAGYREVDPVTQAQFDYSACTLNLAVGGTDFACGGSQTSDPTGFFNVLPDGSGLVSTADCPSSGCVIGAGGTLRPFTANDAYNFGPVNYHQRPDERYTAGVFANFKLSEKADVYGEMMFMDDRSVAQIAASGSFFGQHPSAAASAVVACDGPEFCTEPRPRPDDNATLLMAVATPKAVVPGRHRSRVVSHRHGVPVNQRHESYDVYFQHGETAQHTYLNDFSIRRTGLALNAVDDGTAPRLARECDADGRTTIRAAFSGHLAAGRRHAGSSGLPADPRIHSRLRPAADRARRPDRGLHQHGEAAQHRNRPGGELRRRIP